MIREEDIFQGLVARGLPAHAAQGVTMNLRDESGFDPNVNEAAPTVPGSRGGFGLAQWTGPRRVALEQFAADRGADPGDYNLQLDFLVEELHGPERNALSSLLSTSTPGEAAAAFLRDFERPAQKHLDRREAEYLGGGQQVNALSGYGPEWAAQGPQNVLGGMGQQQPQQNALAPMQLPQAPMLDPAAFMNRRSFI
jgi:hypothetical protein